MSKWGDEQVEQLKAYADQGLSASQAASHFVGMSRNAAVGLAFRNKFHFFGKSNGQRADGQPRRSSNGNRSYAPRTYFKCENVEPIEALIGNCTLSELSHDGCKYIFGDPLKDDHRYCGRPKFNGYSWCVAHCMIVFEQAENGNGPNLNTGRTERDDRRADAQVRGGRTERTRLHGIPEVPGVG